MVTNSTVLLAVPLIHGEYAVETIIFAIASKIYVPNFDK